MLLSLVMLGVFEISAALMFSVYLVLASIVFYLTNSIVAGLFALGFFICIESGLIVQDIEMKQLDKTYFFWTDVVINHCKVQLLCFFFQITSIHSITSIRKERKPHDHTVGSRLAGWVSSSKSSFTSYKKEYLNIQY